MSKITVAAALVAIAMSASFAAPSQAANAGDHGGTICGPSCDTPAKPAKLMKIISFKNGVRIITIKRGDRILFTTGSHACPLGDKWRNGVGCVRNF